MIAFVLILIALIFATTSVIGSVTVIQWLIQTKGQDKSIGAFEVRGNGSDLAAAIRVIERMRSRQMIDASQANAFDNAMIRLRREDLQPPQSRPKSPVAVNRIPNAGSLDQSIKPASTATIAAARQSETGVSELAVNELALNDPGVKKLSALGTPAKQDRPTEVQHIAQPKPPRQRIGDALASFMALHNIRIVEIVAGLLIVVSCIGLVVSLWHTITSTHRAVPAIIFASANSALFVSAFYIFSKWRLPQTGRAIVVIATLLVPLWIIAAMAGGGRTATAMSLVDPITLAVIVGGGAIYSRLLWIAGQIILGRRHAWRWVLTVMSASLTIILMPLLLRHLGGGAGWSIAIVAIPSAWAWLDLSPRRPRGNSLHLVRGIGTLLPISLAMIAASIGNAIAFESTIDPIQLEGFHLSIAATMIPLGMLIAWIGWLIADQSEKTQFNSGANARSVLIRTAATLVGVSTLAIFPAFLISPTWTATYAIVSVVTAVMMVRMGASSIFYVLATIPLGIVWMLLIPHLTGTVDWSQSWLTRLTCDSSILITAAMSAFCAAKSSARTSQRSFAVGWSQAAMGWGGVAGILILGWCMQPAETTRMLPANLPSGLLGAVAIVTVWLSRRNNVQVQFAIAASVVAVASCLKLILIPLSSQKPWIDADQIYLAPIDQWCFASTLLAALVSGWMFWLTRFGLPKTVGRPAFSDKAISMLRTSWTVLASTSLCLGGYCWFIQSTEILAAALVLLGSSALVWRSTNDESAVSIGQVFCFAAVMSLADNIGIDLRHVENWFLPATWFVVSIAIALTCSVWKVLQWNRSDHPSGARVSIRHAIIAMSTGVSLMWIEAWSRSMSSSTIADHRLDQSLLIAAILVGGSVLLVFRTEAKSIGSAWMLGFVSSAGVAMAIGQNLLSVPIDQMMMATALTVGCWALTSLASAVHRISNAFLAGSFAISAISTGIIFQTQWYPAVDAGRLVPVASTASVCGVAGLMAIVCATHAGIRRQPELGRAGGLLLMTMIMVGIPALTMPTHFDWWHLGSLWAAAMLVLCRYTLPLDWRETLNQAATDLQRFTILIGVVGGVVATVALLFHQQEPWMFSTLSTLSTGAALWMLRFKQKLPISATFAVGAGVTAGWIATGSGHWIGWTAIDLLAGLWAAIALANVTVWLTPLRKSDAERPTWIALSILLPWSLAVLITFIAISSPAAWLDYLAVAIWSVIAIASIRWECWSVQSDRLSLLSRISTFIAAIIAMTLLASQFPIPASWGVTAAMTWSACLIGVWRSMRIIWNTPVHQLVRPMVCDASMMILLTMFLAGQCGLLIVSANGFMNGTDKVLITLLASVFCLIVSSGRGRASLLCEGVAAMTTFATTMVLVGQIWAERFPTTLTLTLATFAATGIAGNWIVGIFVWKPLCIIDDRLRGGESRGVSTAMIDLIPVATICIAVWSTLILFDNPSRVLVSVNLAIMTLMVAVAAIAGDVLDSRRNRCLAIATGILTALGWTMIDVVDQPAVGLLSAVRVMVVGSLFAMIFTWILPLLFGKHRTTRWSAEFYIGQQSSIVLAAGGLAATLLTQWSMRTGGVVSAVSDPVVIGVGVWIAISSLSLFAMSVLSGPATKFMPLHWSDGVRKAFILASQAVAVSAWVHLYLCRQSWATSGMSDRWPWIVLAIATVSVLATAIARRFGDRVLSETLSVTSLYLPLIPALGFWATKSTVVLQFLGSRLPTSEGLPYRLVLLVVAIYYVVASSFWKKTWPRLAAMGFGTVALWLHLSEGMGWSFFSHPQAWLVPPAVGVLAMTQWEQRRLEPSVRSALRYAATLTIYVTSTADMIYAGLGNDLSGPIILITLSLAGIAAGMILRVGPLLYLGALFLLVATTGMVVHAGRSLDAVWPWWAFGIGTGLMILGGLIAMERYRPAVKKFIQSVSPDQDESAASSTVSTRVGRSTTT